MNFYDVSNETNDRIFLDRLRNTMKFETLELPAHKNVVAKRNWPVFPRQYFTETRTAQNLFFSSLETSRPNKQSCLTHADELD